MRGRGRALAAPLTSLYSAPSTHCCMCTSMCATGINSHARRTRRHVCPATRLASGKPTENHMPHRALQVDVGGAMCEADYAGYQFVFADGTLPLCYADATHASAAQAVTRPHRVLCAVHTRSAGRWHVVHARAHRDYRCCANHRVPNMQRRTHLLDICLT